MALDAFVLPRPGSAVGVVFWQPARTRRTDTNGRTGEEELRVYAPGPLSEGEQCELLAAYAASVGEALRRGDHAAGYTSALTLWWIAGIAAVLLLGVHALALGPGNGWITVAAGITALPIGVAGGGRFGRTESAAARRAARRVAALTAAEGSDRRFVERATTIWQVARRLQGTEREQLQALESHCREQSWAAGAQVYADLLSGPTTAGHADARARRRLRLPSPFRGHERRAAHYTAVPLRAW